MSVGRWSAVAGMASALGFSQKYKIAHLPPATSLIKICGGIQSSFPPPQAFRGHRRFFLGAFETRSNSSLPAKHSASGTPHGC